MRKKPDRAKRLCLWLWNREGFRTRRQMLVSEEEIQILVKNALTSAGGEVHEDDLVRMLEWVDDARWRVTMADLAVTGDASIHVQPGATEPLFGKPHDRPPLSSRNRRRLGIAPAVEQAIRELVTEHPWMGPSKVAEAVEIKTGHAVSVDTVSRRRRRLKPIPED